MKVVLIALWVVIGVTVVDIVEEATWRRDGFAFRFDGTLHHLSFIVPREGK